MDYLSHIYLLSTQFVQDYPANTYPELMHKMGRPYTCLVWIPFRQAGRIYDQLRNANLYGYWSLVPPTLKYLRSDSLYVCTGEAVRKNCQTAREWRLCV